MVKMTKTIVDNVPQSEIKCLLWHQGENDAELGMSKEEYKKNLSNLIEDYKGKLSLDKLVFIAGDYVPEWKEYTPNAENIAMATQEVVQSKEDCGYVSSQGLVGNPKPDEIHFNRKSLKEFGKRYFDKYIQIINK